VDGTGREPGLAAHRVDDQELTRTGGQETDQGPHLGRSLDLGQLADVAHDEVGQVGVEEALAATRVRPGQRLGKAAPDDAFGVLLAGYRRFVVERRAVLEKGVYEPVGGTVDLALGQRPQLDRLGPAGQRIRQVARWSLMSWCSGRCGRGALVATVVVRWSLRWTEIRLRGPGAVCQPAAVRTRPVRAR
jgi:hypothetical protein